MKENIANKSMHNSPYVLGVISAPDAHYNPVLYSHYQATVDFNTMCEDIYQDSNKYKPVDRKKTPKSVLCVLGAGAIFGAWKLIKHMIKK